MSTGISQQILQYSVLLSENGENTDTSVSGNALIEAAASSAEEVADRLNAFQQFMTELPEKGVRFGIKAVIVIILFFIGSKLIGILRKILKKSMEKARADAGLMHFTDSLVKVALYVLLVVWIASYLGFETTSLVALIGSAGVTAALALQGSLSNITGGALLLLLKPFKIGDYIREDSKGNEGTVTEIGLFYTKLMTIDERTVILPNGTLANTSLTNLTCAPCRTLVANFGISYESDVSLAKKVLRDALNDNALVLKDKPILIYVDSLEDSAVIIGVRVHVKTEDYFELKWGFTERAKKCFEENGISIPYPQMDVHLKEKT